MRVPRFLPFVILALGLPAATPAEAKSHSGRERNALITSVDRKGAILTVEIEAESRPRSFEWNETTRFVQNGRFTGPEALKAGATVLIRYHAPFFGNPFVSNVTLLERPRSFPKTTKRKTKTTP